ncbi:unnamed protein product [Phaedon cochleariae]|uniref:Endonuclease-reverse transcriptase n=1 Tax=Phaedon cochleariae TaxID=80249 RepID=A0A9N9SMU6_PHACE|nr:unnamed protein product [Phaedon cochleariae]
MDDEIKQMFRTLCEQNKEIRDDIKSIKEELLTSNNRVRELEEKVLDLEGENEKLKKCVENGNRKTKENNLIIYGVEEREDSDSLDELINLMKDTLDVNLQEFEVGNIYRIGKKDTQKTRPIVLELVRYLKKQEILSKCNKLKGTGISVSHDLTRQEREEKLILLKYYKEAKEKNYQTKLYRNKLVVNGDIYTYQDLRDRENIQVEKEDRIENNIEEQTTREKAVHTKAAKEPTYATRNQEKSRQRIREELPIPPSKKIKE